MVRSTNISFRVRNYGIQAKMDLIVVLIKFLSNFGLVSYIIWLIFFAAPKNGRMPTGTEQEEHQKRLQFRSLGVNTIAVGGGYLIVWQVILPLLG